jgi:hypothetical protein
LTLTSQDKLCKPERVGTQWVRIKRLAQTRKGKTMAEYKCNACGKAFSSQQELQEHAKTCK